MRYPWKDRAENLLELGDNVIDIENNIGGYITTDEFGIPVIYMTHFVSKGQWKLMDNKGPKEMYIKPLFDTNKSRWYWRRHKYILDNIIKGEKDEFRN